MKLLRCLSACILLAIGSSLHAEIIYYDEVASATDPFEKLTHDMYQLREELENETTQLKPYEYFQAKLDNLNTLTMENHWIFDKETKAFDHHEAELLATYQKDKKDFETKKKQLTDDLLVTKRSLLIQSFNQITNEQHKKLAKIAEEKNNLTINHIAVTEEFSRLTDYFNEQREKALVKHQVNYIQKLKNMKKDAEEAFNSPVRNLPFDESFIIPAKKGWVSSSNSMSYQANADTMQATNCINNLTNQDFLLKITPEGYQVLAMIAWDAKNADQKTERIYGIQKCITVDNDFRCTTMQEELTKALEADNFTCHGDIQRDTHHKHDKEIPSIDTLN